MRNYGIRICLTCGKHYTATYASQVVCCDECKEKRVKEQRKEYDQSRCRSLGTLKRRIKALKNGIKRVASRKPSLTVPNIQNAPQQATEAQKHIYPKTCVVCGRQFQALYPNSKTCPKCIEKHSKLTSVPHLYNDGGDD